MSEPKLIAPLLDGCIMGEAISTHQGISCYPAIDTGTQEKYIVKVISIPASQTQLDALLLTGAYPDNDAALAYFKELADDTVREAEIMQRLARLEGFYAYEGWQVEPMEDGVGFCIYLKSIYRQTLERYLSQNSMTQLAAINLGLDLCAALGACRRCGFLYINTKPGNIYMNDEGEYRLGDLGLVALSSLRYASLPEKYRSCYTAPEISDAYAALNDTMDTYAVGMILYQIFNGGQLPESAAETLPPPAYADHELAEILLKACAADPADRWQDPAQMGQALVSYMQRNGVNDTPIIPPPVQPEEAPAEEIEQTPDAPAESEKETPVPAETLSEEAAEVISVLNALEANEIEPTEEILENLESTDVTDETSEMLAQADELIAHELPAAVVVPEPEEITIVVPEPEETPEDNAAVAVIVSEEESSDEGPVQEAETKEDTSSPEAETKEDTSSPEAEENEEAPVIAAPIPEEEAADAQPPKKKSKKLLQAIAIALIVVLLGFGCYLFYTEVYLQPIEGITLQSTQSQLTVLLDTQINNDLLTVYCTDTYANRKQATVANNMAVFNDLRPNTSYKITVEIRGFHKLTGVTTGTLSTSSQTIVTSFTAVTGEEDGSVILNFSVEGPQTSAWRVYYNAEGEEEKSVDFTGRLVTITGLTIGKEYTYRLEPASALYIGGTTSITHTASNIIYAEDLDVLGFEDGKLTAVWKAPEGVNVSCWNVRCYNDAGYDTTLTVTDTTAVFEGLDPDGAYTVVVKAEGMTAGSEFYISANSVTVSNVQLNTDRTSLTLTWQSDIAQPNGWLVLYRVDGSEQNVIRCDGTTAKLPLIPGAHYNISIQTASGETVFGGKLEHDTEAAPLFTGYWVTAEHMIFNMCRRPNRETWDRSHVKTEDYTTNFTVGEKAAFVIRLNHEYTTSSDKIEILFVIRNADNVPVSIQTVTRTWTNMWYQGYGTQDVPAMPEVAGSYTMEIYYNGASVTTQSFTVS